MQALIK